MIRKNRLHRHIGSGSGQYSQTKSRIVRKVIQSNGFTASRSPEGIGSSYTGGDGQFFTQSFISYTFRHI